MRIMKCLSFSDFNKIKDSYPEISNGCAVALGFFDGVHIAHRALIDVARREADKRGLKLAVFTFIGDNRRMKEGVRRLYSDKDKASLLSECGVDFTVMCDFTSLAGLSPEQFVKDVLINALGSKLAVCGFNFRFGKGASGNADDLYRLMKNYAADAITVPEYLYDDQTVSSTLIRSLVAEKNIRRAAILLGKPYFLCGEVVHGNGAGRTLGIPTVNTNIDDSVFSPPNGVYSTLTEIQGKLFHSITNIGVCPTFGERTIHAETFILDFNSDIYGDEVKVYFLDFIRDEKRFYDEKELIKQINVDINSAKALLEDLKWQEIGLKLQ